MWPSTVITKRITAFLPQYRYLYRNGSEYLGFYSVHCRLLGYLKSRPLYDAINFETGTWPTDTFLVAPTAQQLALDMANGTALHTGVSVFLCPSDGGPLGEAGNNYRGNAGVGPSFLQQAETPDSGNGVFPEIGMVTMAQVPDGLAAPRLSVNAFGAPGPRAPVPSADVFRRLGIANTGTSCWLPVDRGPARQRGGFRLQRAVVVLDRAGPDALLPRRPPTASYPTARTAG